MEIETEMRQPLVAVCLERPSHLVWRPDHERGTAVADPRQVSELADRREPVESAPREGGRLKVDPNPIEIKDLVQAASASSQAFSRVSARWTRIGIEATWHLDRSCPNWRSSSSYLV
jgi:hypothetical protein